MATIDHPPVVETTTTTGRKYATVEQMLQGEGASPDFAREVAVIADATRVTRILAGMRAAHGLTQKEMGEKIGVTQGAISKLEAGRDEDLRLSEVCAYARALNERVGVVYGPSPSHAEAVTAHLRAAKYHMFELAKVAQKDAEMDNRMNKFFGDTFESVMTMLAEVYTNLPNGIKGCEFSMEVIHCHPSIPDTRPPIARTKKDMAFA